MVKIAEMLRRKGGGMWYWAIPTRKTMYEENRLFANRSLGNNLNGLATSVTTEMESISRNQYLVNFKCWVDGTHFNEDHCPGVCLACGKKHPQK